MPILIHLRQLELKSLELKGKLPVEELELNGVDECIHLRKPVEYQLEVEKLEESILVRGSVVVDMECDCVRCLKTFPYKMDLEEWTCHLELEGEEKVEIKNDTIDLTPYLREDILLGFPRHPLCNAECEGLQKRGVRKVKKTGGTSQNANDKSAWAELNRLKF